MYCPQKAQDQELYFYFAFLSTESPDQNIRKFQLTTSTSTVDMVDSNLSFAKVIEVEFYIHYFLKSNTLSILDRYYKVSYFKFKKYNFRIAKFASNCQEIIDKLPSSEIIYQTSICQQNVDFMNFMEYLN